MFFDFDFDLLSFSNSYQIDGLWQIGAGRRCGAVRRLLFARDRLVHRRATQQEEGEVPPAARWCRTRGVLRTFETEMKKKNKMEKTN